MASNLDIYRTAELMCAQHGADAIYRALDRARELAAWNDNESLLWLGVARMIRDIEREREPRETLH